MAIGPRLDIRQTQSLVMTPQLRQAIKLLQFSNLEVGAFVEAEMESNPLLDLDDRTDTTAERPALDQRTAAEAPARDAADHVADTSLPDAAHAPLDADHTNTYDAGGVADGATPTDLAYGRRGGQSFDTDDRGIDELAESPPSLREHLGAQLRLTFDDPADRIIAAHLIALLCPAGRLTAAPDAIATAMGTTLDRVESVRARMMRFDPVGLFATDLRECLSVQLAEKNRLDPAMEALLENLDLLARRDMRRLMAACEVDAEDMVAMIAELRALDPKPGAIYDAAPAQTLIPDVLMRALPDGAWFVELNPETMPRVLVNQAFYTRVLPKATRDEKLFLAERLQTANWLVKSLQQRAQTILRVSAEIVRQQDAFFRNGVAHLRPLILRDIADSVELHESTVSRVTASKYIATPRGTFELKYFFTTAIASSAGGESHSAESVRQRIRAMVNAEAADDILSDDAIVAALRREGVDIARRTVAKYRDALRIPSSVQRKRERTVAA